MKRDWSPGGPVPDRDAEVREELDFYIEERARELEEEGLTPEEARRQALEAFGDMDRISAEVSRIRREKDRDEGRRRTMGSMLRHVRLALRGIRRRPGFSFVVIATLALGIGAVTATFTVVNASLLASLPFENADRIVLLQGAYDAPEGPAIRGASVPEVSDWAVAESFDHVAAVTGASVTLTGDGPAAQLSAQQVGAGYFTILGVTPQLGRLFTAEEMTPPGDHRVALLSDALWTSHFGRDPSIVGRSIILSGQTFEVVGVLPEGFEGTSLQARLWLPWGNPLAGPSPERVVDRGTRWLQVLARLAPGATVEGARAEMQAITTALEAQYPEDHEDRIALVTPMREFYMGDTRALVLIMLGSTGLLLLIASANVANLLLVRATGRGGEVHMRKALGAGRGQIAEQFLVESVVLTGLGALGGLVLGGIGVRAFVNSIPDAILPSYVDPRPDLAVFAIVAILMGVVGLLAGLAPALLSSKGDPAPALRSRQGGMTKGAVRLQSALVIGEVALALLIMVGAGLLTRSVRAQLAVSPGFDAESLYVFRVNFPREIYTSAEAVTTAVEDIRGRFDSNPSVASVTFASDAPLRGGSTASFLFLENATEEERIRFYIHRVADGWFETLGTTLERGRALNRDDAEQDVTVISNALASRFFSETDPVGKSVSLFSPDGEPLRIVGVAEEVRYRDLTSDLIAGDDDPAIYVPWYGFESSSVEFVLRASGDIAPLGAIAQEVVTGVDPNLPIINGQPMSEHLGRQTAQLRFGSALLGTFAAVASLLALVGLYGILSFSVDRRQREIAIRVAVGAQREGVRRLVVGQGMKIVSAGLILGLVTAVFASKTLDAFLFGVAPVDLSTYGAVTLLLAAVALVAMWIPAERATRVDPNTALTSE